ncbi:MAG: NAD(P)(+) transhydrogenase (Re/Si-specific) subunit beta [Calditrichia bacterium]
MSTQLIALSYLVASVLFILGLKGLSHPRTAVRGNLLGALGMFVAIVATLLQGGLSFDLILVGVLIGSLIGAMLAIKIEMTSMPELVAVLNGFGGLASFLIAGAELMRGGELTLQLTPLIAIATSGIIGSVTFLGSLIAFGKLKGFVTEKPVRYTGEQIVKLLFLVGSVALGVMVVQQPEATDMYWIMIAVACALGVILVLPIGGADMPVVVALLNSYSGLAASATGFVLSNSVLIIAGSLVGASGLILTNIMCKAMNRSLTNVLFGGFGEVTEAASADDVYEGKIKRTSPDELAILLDTARQVTIVPGYGMAVAQAQHAVRDLFNLLEGRGVNVDFAIHPVAGRMPGHMNVLLAEADIPYDKLLEMDAVNQTIEQVDVAIVLGANDVVNPLARTDPKSAIAGMPIINVDMARTVIVIKRSLSPGFAGIPNPLFAADNALMLFGDGKKMIQESLAALKEN